MASEVTYEVACKTEGAPYDTGIRIRGLEVWACPPHHYRHYTTLFLRHPQVFEVEPIQDPRYRGEWILGFTRPDGKTQVAYCSYKTRDDAEAMLDTCPDARTARLTCQFEVGYKADGKWAAKETGRPWGTVWAGGLLHPDSWEGFVFDLTEAEAAEILAFREDVDAEWKRRAEGWIAEEYARDRAIAEAVALDDLPASVVNKIAGPTECLECGATYDHPGHVEAGGMGCDRCNN